MDIYQSGLSKFEIPETIKKSKIKNKGRMSDIGVLYSDDHARERFYSDPLVQDKRKKVVGDLRSTIRKNLFDATNIPSFLDDDAEITFKVDDDQEEGERDEQYYSTQSSRTVPVKEQMEMASGHHDLRRRSTLKAPDTYSPSTYNTKPITRKKKKKKAI